MAVSQENKHSDHWSERVKRQDCRTIAIFALIRTCAVFERKVWSEREMEKRDWGELREGFFSQNARGSRLNPRFRASRFVFSLAFSMDFYVKNLTVLFSI